MALTTRSLSGLGRALLAALAFTSVGAGLQAAGSHYYVNDHLATTVGIADASGEIAALEADAFGSPLAASGAPNRYTGKPYDDDMGAFVFPFRNYRAVEGRWMTGDPSGFPDGLNGRLYCPNVSRSVDPLGLATVTAEANFDSGWDPLGIFGASQAIHIGYDFTVTYNSTNLNFEGVSYTSADGNNTMLATTTWNQTEQQKWVLQMGGSPTAIYDNSSADYHPGGDQSITQRDYNFHMFFSRRIETYQWQLVSAGSTYTSGVTAGFSAGFNGATPSAGVTYTQTTSTASTTGYAWVLTGVTGGDIRINFFASGSRE